MCMWRCVSVWRCGLCAYVCVCTCIVYAGMYVPGYVCTDERQPKELVLIAHSFEAESLAYC